MKKYLFKAISVCGIALLAFACGSTNGEKEPLPPLPPTTIPVTGVAIENALVDLTLKVGATGVMVAAVAPQDATDKNATWSSDADAIATVDQNGVVTAVAVGSANITVTTTDGGHTASRRVVVSEDPVLTYTVAITVYGNGAAKATIAGEVVKEAVAGAEITITATPEEGADFLNWTVVSGGVTLGSEAATTFIMPAEDVEIKAEFTKLTFLFEDLSGTYAASGEPNAIRLVDRNIGKGTWNSEFVPHVEGSVKYYEIKNFGGSEDISVYLNVDVEKQTIAADDRTRVAYDSRYGLAGLFSISYIDDTDTIYFLEATDNIFKWDIEAQTLDMSGIYNGYDILVGVVAFSESTGVYGGVFSDVYANCKFVMDGNGLTAAGTAKVAVSKQISFASRVRTIEGLKDGGWIKFDPTKFSRK